MELSTREVDISLGIHSCFSECYRNAIRVDAGEDGSDQHPITLRGGALQRHSCALATRSQTLPYAVTGPDASRVQEDQRAELIVNVPH
jgi:hypothetical protein